MKIEEEEKGQFPSKNCECHFQEPYGFVPEADCPEHDTEQFREFIDKIVSDSDVERKERDSTEWKEKFRVEVTEPTMEALDEMFPKGKCQERGGALYLFATAIVKAQLFIESLIDGNDRKTRSTKDNIGED